MRGEAGRTDQGRLAHRQVLPFIPPVELFGIRGGRVQLPERIEAPDHERKLVLPCARQILGRLK